MDHLQTVHKYVPNVSSLFIRSFDRNSYNKFTISHIHSIYAYEMIFYIIEMFFLLVSRLCQLLWSVARRWQIGFDHITTMIAKIKFIAIFKEKKKKKNIPTWWIRFVFFPVEWWIRRLNNSHHISLSPSLSLSSLQSIVVLFYIFFISLLHFKLLKIPNN